MILEGRRVQCRTTRQVNQMLATQTQERPRLCPTACAIKTDAIKTNASRMSFDELLLGDDGPFNSAQYIPFG